MAIRINARPSDLASTVIMPGDSLCAKFTIENYLIDYREITNVHNMLGCTGLYFGQPVSVMGHGVGIPPITPYAYELVHDFGVQRTVYAGSLGTIQHHVKTHDIILAIAAGTDSITNLKRSAGYAMAASAYFPLSQQTWALAQKVGTGIKAGNVFSGDLYHDPDESLTPALEKFGVLGIGTEVAGSYALTHQLNIRALAILTVSGHYLTGEKTTVEE